MKKFFLFAFVFFCSISVFAQSELLVQSNDKGLYLNHTVVAKENFYSIGRLYNLAPKDIAAFNNLDMNNGLSIGQSLKIPLNATNFSQDAAHGRPVFYTVGQKEGLYRVSLKNNTVLMANLRKWNHLTNDKITPGQKLIVGYLTSADANNIVQTNPVTENKPPADEPKKEVVIEKKEPPVIEKKEEPKKEVVKEKTEFPPVPKQVGVNGGNGGYFEPQYEQQIKLQSAKYDQTASAGIFKTASGWQDAKYYALMDHVEPGTIIKIINPTNNKAVYVKVLGEMSGIRQNAGYDVRISNAAASALEVTETDKFIVRINY